MRRKSTKSSTAAAFSGWKALDLLEERFRFHRRVSFARMARSSYANRCSSVRTQFARATKPRNLPAPAGVSAPSGTIPPRREAMRRIPWMLAAALAVSGPASPADGPALRTVADAGDWCDESRRGGSHDIQHCEVREAVWNASGAPIAVDAQPNGGIQVTGWDRNEVRLRVKIVASGDTAEEARARAAGVRIETDGTIRAVTTEGKAWASFRLEVPRASLLNLTSHNGGINLESLSGTVEARTTNGGVHLERMARQGHRADAERRHPRRPRGRLLGRRGSRRPDLERRRPPRGTRRLQRAPAHQHRERADPRAGGAAPALRREAARDRPRARRRSRADRDAQRRRAREPGIADAR